MKYLGTFILIAAVFAAGFFGARLGGGSDGAAVAQAETAYERILRTGIIRCGYGTWPPYMVKDPNTGELSGINYDVMELIGKELNVQIDWVQEVGWGSMKSDLESGRFDVVCSTLWDDSDRIKHMTLTKPHFYSALHAYVRADDFRFDGNLTKLDSADYTVAAIDADSTFTAAKINFPAISVLALPENSHPSDIMLSVVTGKADVAFLDSGVVRDFGVNNPGKLRKVDGVEPVRIFGEVLAVRPGEIQLRDVLDDAANTIINNGKMDEIIRNYSDDYLLPARPYKE